jgi:hypothetical protein
MEYLGYQLVSGRKQNSGESAFGALTAIGAVR